MILSPRSFVMALALGAMGAGVGACRSDFECAVGTDACDCTVNGGCDPGLSCLSGTCVQLPGETGDEEGGDAEGEASEGETSEGEASEGETGDGDGGDGDGGDGDGDGDGDASGVHCGPGCVLLLHFDGADAGTELNDASLVTPHQPTAESGAQLSSTAPAFGSASALFDGSTAHLALDDDADFTFDGNFTLDFWFRSEDSAGTVWHQGHDTGGLTVSIGTPDFASVGITESKIGVYVNDGVGLSMESTSSVDDGNWHHFALTRAGSTMRLFVDGFLQANALFEGAIDQDHPVRVGGYGVGARDHYAGELDELRLLNGHAAWLGNFDVHEAAFANPRGLRVFASSSLHEGNLGGVAGADAICQGLADSSSRLDAVPVMALLGSERAQVGATNRLPRLYPLVRLDGELIAPGATSLFDGAAPAVAVGLDEEGNPITGSTYAWTGLTNTGAGDDADCGGWNTNMGIGQRGSTIAIADADWLSFGAAVDCVEPQHLLCVERPPARPSLAFVLSEVASPSFGQQRMGGADALCQSEADDAGYRVPMMAWLSDSTQASPVSPVTRFDHSDQPYWLGDGSVVAQDWVDLVDGTLDTPINLEADGISEAGFALAWSGTEDDGTPSGIDCVGWSTSNEEESGHMASAEETSNWSHAGSNHCGTQRLLLCFEQ